MDYIPTPAERTAARNRIREESVRVNQNYRDSNESLSGGRTHLPAIETPSVMPRHQDNLIYREPDLSSHVSMSPMVQKVEDKGVANSYLSSILTKFGLALGAIFLINTYRKSFNSAAIRSALDLPPGENVGSQLSNRVEVNTEASVIESGKSNSNIDPKGFQSEKSTETIEPTQIKSESHSILPIVVWKKKGLVLTHV